MLTPHYKALLWTISTTAVGLLNLAFPFFRHLLDNRIDSFLDQPFREGIFLFFCSAIVGAVAIDSWLGKKNYGYSDLQMLGLFGFPFVITVVSTILYAMVFDQKNINGEEELRFVRTQWFLFCSTLIYVTVAKTIHYKIEEMNQRFLDFYRLTSR